MELSNAVNSCVLRKSEPRAPGGKIQTRSPSRIDKYFFSAVLWLGRYLFFVTWSVVRIGYHYSWHNLGPGWFHFFPKHPDTFIPSFHCVSQGLSQVHDFIAIKTGMRECRNKHWLRSSCDWLGSGRDCTVIGCCCLMPGMGVMRVLDSYAGEIVQSKC